MSFRLILPLLISMFGLIFTIRVRFFFVTHPVRVFRSLRRALGGHGAFRSLMLALAGTLGVGNIVGVAFGISVGGAGSVLWMLVSSIFAAVIKYFESTLAADVRYERHGGMPLVISSSFGRVGRPLSLIYTALCLLLSLVLGSALQARTVVGSSDALGIPPPVAAALFAVLVLLPLLRGTERIAAITALIIPITAALYILLCLAVILMNVTDIPCVLSEIFASAFSPSATVGGIVGTLMSQALGEGFSRGLLSNEAGLGTSAFAQSRAEHDHPTECGLLGMCEVIFDTVILCTLTALAILTALPPEVRSGSGMELVIAAFTSALGSISVPVLNFIVISFAYSTVICWYFYGRECMDIFTFSKKTVAKLIYTALFVTALVISFVLSEDILICASDVIMLPMAAITLLTLMKSSERVVRLSESAGFIRSKKSDMRERGKAALGHRKDE